MSSSNKKQWLAWFKQALAVLLIFQVILGPCDLAWGQSKNAQRGEMPSKGKAAHAPGPARGDAASGVQAAGIAEEQVPGGQALSKAVVPNEYVLGPGDGLNINLWGEYNESFSVKVSPDGKISLGTIGDLEVKDLTLTRASKLIESRVNHYYHGVNTGVSLTQLRVFEVQVLGEVPLPGAYLATPIKRVSNVVAQAGGVRPGGSQRLIQIHRNSTVAAVADLVLFLREGDQSMNPFLKDGDMIFVPPMGNNRVVVHASEVTAGVGSGSGGGGGGGGISERSIPMVMEIKPGERLSRVVSEIGGMNPWWDLESVTIERVSQRPEGTMRIPVDLARFFYEQDESQNPILQSGDVIYIPAIIKRVFVGGAVNVPAAYTYIPGKTVDAYLVQAGGPNPVADLSRSFIVRANGTREPFNGAAELNNGDSIVVIEKLLKTYQDYFALVGTLTGVVLSLVGFYAAFTVFGR